MSVTVQGKPVITQFGPDDVVTSLPADFRACLSRKLTAQQKDDMGCDALVGSLATGAGYCGKPGSRYVRQTYCACANSPVPCPMIAAAACANSPVAYRPTDMMSTGEAYQACKGATICINTVAVGGSQNVTSGINQQCGNIQNIKNVISASPSLAAITFVLFIVLVLLLLAKTDDSPGAAYSAMYLASSSLPPPPDFALP